jgi:methionine aminotransferase
MLPQKIPNGPSIFSVMSQLANQHGAINLAQGFPNFPIDETLQEAVAKAARGSGHQYVHYQGLPALREAIRNLIFRNDGSNVTVDQILITAGATQAIFTAIQALVAKGDEVVLLDPCYDCYETPVLLIGGIPVHVELSEEFLPDWNVINQAVNSNTKMIIINTPHNPSGRVWSTSDFKELEALLLKHPNLLVLSDEVYEYLSYDCQHYSTRLVEVLSERTVVVSSFGKSLQATGWKIGYLTAPEPLMNEILRVHQFLVFSVNSVMQNAIASYLPSFYPETIRSEYHDRKVTFTEALSSSRFRCLPCEGTYFQTVEYTSISTANDVDFCHWLTVEKGVAAIPLSVFYNSKKDLKHIRLCFAKDDETLINAANKLCKI